jgi:hypothetical protein
MSLKSNMTDEWLRDRAQTEDGRAALRLSMNNLLEMSELAQREVDRIEAELAKHPVLEA